MSLDPVLAQLSGYDEWLGYSAGSAAAWALPELTAQEKADTKANFDEAWENARFLGALTADLGTKAGEFADEYDNTIAYWVAYDPGADPQVSDTNQPPDKDLMIAHATKVRDALRAIEADPGGNIPT